MESLRASLADRKKDLKNNDNNKKQKKKKKKTQNKVGGKASERQ
jgi:hypothetical protein